AWNGDCVGVKVQGLEWAWNGGLEMGSEGAGLEWGWNGDCVGVKVQGLEWAWNGDCVGVKVGAGMVTAWVKVQGLEWARMVAGWGVKVQGWNETLSEVQGENGDALGVKELLDADFGPPLHSFIIPGELHPMEEEILASYRACGLSG
ncbi:hypothetical protein CYMTET_17720, partial [Cymbomonas tetramitiformis]